MDGDYLLLSGIQHFCFCRRQWALIKAQLAELIDPAQDSLRFYRPGNQYKSKVEQLRVAPAWAQDDLLLL